MRKYISLLLSLILAAGLLSGCADRALKVLDVIDDALSEELDNDPLIEDPQEPSEPAQEPEEKEPQEEEPEVLIPDIQEPEEPEPQEPAEEIPEPVQPAEEKEDVTSDPDPPVEEPEPVQQKINENGTYITPEEVAEYIATYNKLPSNFITKKDAEALGWDSSKGNLQKIAPGKSIGGDYFGNYEKILPTAKGRKYTECDVNYTGGYRGGERVVFSNDGLIYYTNDHYNTFTLLYKDGVKQ